jgi:hypothetical protein
MGLSTLDDPSQWAELLAEDDRTLYMTRHQVFFAVNHLPKIIRLIQREDAASLPIGSDHENPEAVLTVLVLEEGGHRSRPTRLVEVLSSVETFYECCAILLNMPPHELSVVACDSGSDKSFDFLGAAKVIECVKDLILSLWDRVVYFREHQTSQRIRLVKEALPVVQQIADLEAKRQLAPEQAQILRDKVTDAVGKFLESGAVIPEIEERVYHEPRRLMAPEQKLITSRSTVSPEPSEETLDRENQTRSARKKPASKPRTGTKEKHRTSSNRLTASERSQYERLRKKMQSDKGVSDDAPDKV